MALFPAVALFWYVLENDDLLTFDLGFHSSFNDRTLDEGFPDIHFRAIDG